MNSMESTEDPSTDSDSSISYEICKNFASTNDASFLVAQSKYLSGNDGEWLNKSEKAAIASGEYVLGILAYVPYALVELSASARNTLERLIEKSNEAPLWLVYHERIANTPMDKVYAMYKSLDIPEGRFLMIVPAITCSKTYQAEIKELFPEFKAVRIRDVPTRNEEVLLLKHKPLTTIVVGGTKHLVWILSRPAFKSYLSDFEREVHDHQK